MKKLFLVLMIVVITISTIYSATTKTHKSIAPVKPKSLKIRYYLTDKDYNPTVNFNVGETYYLYMSIQNITPDSISFKSRTTLKPMFHYIALKSSDSNFPARFNNQIESLQIPLDTEQDTVLGSHEIIDDYQPIEFLASGFYTIQIMPNLLFPAKYNKDWGKLQFDIECHGNPSATEDITFQDLKGKDDLAPILDKLLDNADLNSIGQ